MILIECFCADLAKDKQQGAAMGGRVLCTPKIKPIPKVKHITFYIFTGKALLKHFHVFEVQGALEQVLHKEGLQKKIFIPKHVKLEICNTTMEYIH